MSNLANYANTPNNGTPGILTTGDTSRTAPTSGNAPTIFTAGASGSRVDNVDFTGLATTTATGVRLFLYDGVTFHLLTERAVLALTAVAGLVWELHIGDQTDPQIFPIILKTGWSLRATVNDTQTGIKAAARGGDF